MPDGLDTFVEEVGFALRGIYSDAAKDAADGGLSFDHLDDNAAKYAKERGGELIGGKGGQWSIEETTRTEANKLLQEAMAEGLSPQAFAQRLEDEGLFTEARAEVVARTEVAIAQNYGQSETYAELGFDRVYVQDGDCDICRQVDGKVASIAWIQENPVGHPNCVRSCSPAPSEEPIELE